MIEFNRKRIQRAISYLFITLAVSGAAMLLGCNHSENKAIETKEDTSAGSKNPETYQELGFFGKIKDDK